jgi:hypothetical protein
MSGQNVLLEVLRLLTITPTKCPALNTLQWLAEAINSHLFFTDFNSMNTKQFDQLKLQYAEMLVEGMDMDTLIVFAVESIEQNLKDYTIEDLKEEVTDCYGVETWMDMMPESPQQLTEIGALEATAPDYGVGK